MIRKEEMAIEVLKVNIQGSMELLTEYHYSFISPFINTFLILGSMYLVLFLNKKRTNMIGMFFLLALGISWLGITVGIFAGNSREPAVNTIISSALTLIGGLLVFLFDKKSKDKSPDTSIPQNSFIPLIICLLLLPINMLYGAVIGSHCRANAEHNELQIKLQLEQDQKYNDMLMRVDEDSIKVFLEIYRDSILNSYKR